MQNLVYIRYHNYYTIPHNNAIKLSWPHYKFLDMKREEETLVQVSDKGNKG